MKPFHRRCDLCEGTGTALGVTCSHCWGAGEVPDKDAELAALRKVAEAARALRERDPATTSPSTYAAAEDALYAALDAIPRTTKVKTDEGGNG